MGTIKRMNTWFVVDLLISALTFLFASKYVGMYHQPFIFSLFVTFVPIFLRANISYLLSRNEKYVGRSLLIFVMISLWGIFTLSPFERVWGKMGNWGSYGLMALGIADIPFYHIGNYQFTTDVFTGYFCSFFILTSLCWFYILPIIRYVIKLVAGKLTNDGRTSWVNIFCAYRGNKQMQKYMVYFAFVYVAFMVGSAMPLYGWTLTVLFLPLLAYYGVNRMNGYSAKSSECALLLLSAVILWYSQFYRNEWRIVGLAINAALIVVMCWVLHRRMKKWGYPICLALFVGFILPNLSLGYNLYAEIHTSRMGLLTTSLSHSGVFRVMSDNGYGLRDRHRIILEPEYDALSVEDYNSDFIRVRKNGIWLKYDVCRESWVGESTIDMNLQTEVTDLLKSELKNTGTKLGHVIVMERETGEIKVMTGWDYRRMEDGYSVEDFSQPVKSELYSTAALLSVYDKGNLLDDRKENLLRDFISGRTFSFYAGVAGMYHNDITSLRKQLRSLGYGLPVTIPTLTEQNKIQHTMGDVISNSVVEDVYNFSARAVEISPIQMLAFYNGIANDGKMVSPMLAKERTKVVVGNMASDVAIQMIQNDLRESFRHNDDLNYLDISGRFAMTESSNVDWNTMKYRMEFGGYFPSENPKYSILIVLEKNEKPASAEFVSPLLNKLVYLLTETTKEKGEDKGYCSHPPIPTFTYTLNDYLFVDTVGSTPQNEQITVYDKQGRLLAKAGRASESIHFSYYKYLYDRKGKHIGFSTLWEEAHDYPFITDSVLPFNDRPYDVNSLYYDLVERKYNDRYVERFHFVWDKQGNIIKVHDPITDKELVAPVGKKLVYQLEEDEEFWDSDLRGGDYHLKFYIVPMDTVGVKPDTIVYEGYKPFVKQDMWLK